MDVISYKTHSKKSGIYIIKWDNNPNFYIGQSVDLHARMRQHKCELRNNKHKNKRLQFTYIKYGEPIFMCVIICSPGDLDKFEQELIDTHRNDKNLCNMCYDAKGIIISDETKRKISKSRSGTNLSDNHKKNISIGLKEAYRNGRVSNLRGLNGSKNMFFGKTHSDEFKNKQSKNMKGRLVGGKNGRAVIVLDLNTGIFFDCIKDAAECFNLNVSNLRNMLSGYKKNKTSLIKL